MGYRSEIAIAMTVEVYTRNLLENFIPDFLLNLPKKKVGEAVYWHMKDFPWNSESTEVKELEEMFTKLEAILMDTPGREIDTDYGPYIRPAVVYGAHLIGEDEGDFDTWGTPWEFGIESYRKLSSPFY